MNKKHWIVALLIIVVSVCILEACVKMPDWKPAAPSEISYSFQGGNDMAALFGFKATYLNADKKLVTEEITALPWTKTITVTPPFTASLEVGFVKKSNIPQQDSYTVGYTGTILVKNPDKKSEIQKTAADVMRINRTISDGMIRFSIDLPDGVPADRVGLSIPPLKYDKHFAFSYTADDAVEGAYARVWRRINRKQMDTTEFFHMGVKPSGAAYMPRNTLGYTDGCGNERRFPVGVALWATWGDALHPNGRVQDRSTSIYNIYITWEELAPILDFGGAVYYHNVNEMVYDKNDPGEVRKGFAVDRAKTVEKLGRVMKVLAHPDGTAAYLEAAETDDGISLIRTNVVPAGQHGNYVYLSSCGSLYKKRVYSGSFRTADDKLRELADQSASGNPYWVNLTTHRVSTDVVSMLETINDMYGKDGKDNIWFATMDEVYEYVTMREEAEIRKRVDGNKIIFEVSVPSLPGAVYKDLSFLLSDAGSGCTVTPLSDDIVGLSYAEKGGDLLININLNPSVPALAEKYTSRYEVSADETDKEDAFYFASMLLPELASPFLTRIDKTANAPFALNTVSFDGAASSTYDQTVRVTLGVGGRPTHYRVGAVPDLSAVPWSEYVGNTFVYDLGKDYGEKRVYVQLKNETQQSGIVSAAIDYCEIPLGGTVGKDKIDAYVKKYASYKFKYSKTIKAGEVSD